MNLRAVPLRCTTSVAVIAAIAACLAAPAALAQDPTAHYRQGVELRRQGHDEQALAEFRRAHELSPSAQTLAQIGLAEQALGRWVEAHRHLDEAVQAEHPWVERNRATLRQALAVIERRVGRLEVRGGVEGAEVRIAGERVGTLPMGSPVPVVAGAVELTVRAPGYGTVRRTVQVPGGTLARETIEMHRTDEAEPTGEAHGVQEPQEAIERAGAMALPPKRDVPEDGRPAESRGSLLPALGWTAIGAAALSFVGATVAWRIREGRASDWNDDERCLAPGVTREELCGSDRDAAEAAELASIVQLALGGLLAATGVTLLMLAPDDPEEPSTGARAVCGAGPGLVGASCGVRF